MPESELEGISDKRPQGFEGHPRSEDDGQRPTRLRRGQPIAPDIAAECVRGLRDEQFGCRATVDMRPDGMSRTGKECADDGARVDDRFSGNRDLPGSRLREPASRDRS